MSRHKQEMVDRFNPIRERVKRLMPEGEVEFRFNDYDNTMFMDIKLGDRVPSSILLRQPTTHRASGVWDLWDEATFDNIETMLIDTLEELNSAADPGKGSAPQLDKHELEAALLEYLHSEGCTCCQDQDRHSDALDKIGALMGWPRFEDGSGVDWYSVRNRKRDTKEQADE